MISEEDNWNKVVGKIEDKLDEWKLLDKSRVTYTSPIEDGYKKNEYIRYIPIISKLADSQLEKLKTLNQDSDGNFHKTPKLEERINEEGIWLMVY
ncbi:MULTISPECIES: hypothetical protein [Methanobacterium]|uniref:Uncharacterized protein n=1 Tax=Methanobacterium veterum TaxID=408577 RepID=A0A9E5A7J2_9EURY|nr:MULTISPECIES: hypothetical protein [Methanobacterium]MCZ3367056.1 hypothetical protein [Methanobacterium veterum]MCZ3373797.1 hypothetical protein [Methanobacterium veterum]